MVPYSTILYVIGAALVVYAFFNVPNMKFIPLIIGVAICVAGYSLSEATLPVPVPPAPGPGPGPSPPGPAPAPQGFAADVKAAWKQDGGTKTHAAHLSVMADIMAEMIRKDKTLKDASDIGARWEVVRGAIYPPLISWCPYTTQVLLNEITERKQNIGPIADVDRDKYAALWDEFSKALLE